MGGGDWKTIPNWRRLNIYHNGQLATDHNPWLRWGGNRKVHYRGNWGKSTVFLSHVNFSAYGRCIVVMEVKVLALRRSGLSLGIRNVIKCHDLTLKWFITKILMNKAHVVKCQQTMNLGEGYMGINYLHFSFNFFKFENFQNLSWEKIILWFPLGTFLKSSFSMYTYSWFMLMYGGNQYNILKLLSFN